MSRSKRKEYQALLNGSLALTPFSQVGQTGSSPASNVPSVQRPHVDYQTYNLGLEYFYLGNGLIQAAIQHSTVPSSGTPVGLLLMHPDHFARKSSTLLFHPESGVERTMLTLFVNEKVFYPTAHSVEIHWEYPTSIPTVVATWRAGRCTVREEFWCPIGVPILFRRVKLTNNGSSKVDVQVQATLYPNPTLFDEEICYEKQNILEANGYLSLQLLSVEEARAHDRWVTASLGLSSKGAEASATVVYRLGESKKRIRQKDVALLRKKTSEYWRETSDFQSGKFLDHLFRVAKNGLRSAVSKQGRLDSGPLQYNQEWVRDESMIVVGLAMSGQEKLARTVLDRMLDKMVTAEGVTLESSRWRGHEMYELDQNGSLLYSIWMYWKWTNDRSIIEKYWKKIVAAAEFPLRPEFWDTESGLLKSVREYWERSASFGVREGYELTYQLWPAIGLEKAAEIAEVRGYHTLAARWQSAGEKIRHGMLSSPKFAMIQGGRFIKRRLVNGEVQTVFEPPDRSAMPPGMPLAVEERCYCEPDTQEALPIALEFVPPDSGLARNTMAELEKLWNQRWDFGGYARYNVASEPDSPGPWPFATMFMVRAYHEMGDDEKVWRALRWLYEVQGGKAGTWFEFYGDRPVPPLPPTSLIPWTWAEMIIYLVHHFLGVRPGRERLVIRPRLLSGIKEVKARIKVRGKWLTLRIRRGRRKEARVGGEKIKLVKRTLTIPFPKQDVKIEVTI